MHCSANALVAKVTKTKRCRSMAFLGVSVAMNVTKDVLPLNKFVGVCLNVHVCNAIKQARVRLMNYVIFT